MLLNDSKLCIHNRRLLILLQTLVAFFCCWQGNINLINAAVRHGVKKFVLVTSIGVGALTMNMNL